MKCPHCVEVQIVQAASSANRRASPSIKKTFALEAGFGFERVSAAVSISCKRQLRRQMK